MPGSHFPAAPFEKPKPYFFENEEQYIMLTILAFLIPSLLAIGLLAYLLLGIIIYLHGLYKATPAQLQSHPSA
ncbi:MAG: hypothetical protein QOF02_3735 [Blastocatellia bacterium]|jgi:uncharacterized membrane protein YiaA|nr:hypothetical protein [Blastocatellia bacterium]